MRQHVKLLFLIATVFLFTGCTTVANKQPNAHLIPMPPIQPQKGAIVFFQERWGGIADKTVVIDDMASSIDTGQYVVWNLPAGNYMVVWKNSYPISRVLRVNVTAGERVFVHRNMTLFSDGLAVVESSDAKQLIANSLMVNSFTK